MGLTDSTQNNSISCPNPEEIFLYQELACCLAAAFSSTFFTLTFGRSKKPLLAEPASEGTAVMVPTTTCEPPPPTDFTGNRRPPPTRGESILKFRESIHFPFVRVGKVTFEK